MRFKVVSLTNVGKKKSNNEDSLLLDDRIVSDVSQEAAEIAEFSGDRLAFCVADGVGGHAKGEVASRRTLEVFRDRAAAVPGIGELRDLLISARRELNRLVEADGQVMGLGTAIAGLLIEGGRGLAFNCGDCRVYRLNGRFLDKLTHDHSLVQQLFDSGALADEDAMNSHPRKNVITSAVIGDLRDDPPEVFAPDPVELAPGQVYFICSDGVWESMERAALEACFDSCGGRMPGTPQDRSSAAGGDSAAPQELSAVAAKLYDRVMAGPARDNFSLILVEVAA